MKYVICTYYFFTVKYNLLLYYKICVKSYNKSKNAIHSSNTLNVILIKYHMLHKSCLSLIFVSLLNNLVVCTNKYMLFQLSYILGMGRD